MSIDINLTINTGKYETRVIEVGNMTHNVQPMWSKALKETSDIDMNLCDFDKWLANDALPLLQKALSHMQANKSEYLPLNPPNRWGSYETAVEFLSDFYMACRDHPACTIHTDC